MVGEVPGLRRLKRPSGKIDTYWVADSEAVKSGFRPRTVRLRGSPSNPDDFLAMSATCHRLTAEVLEWKAGRKATGNRQPLGTIAWLCDAFETDPDSPYRAKRADTQHFYSRYCKVLKETVGKRLYKTATGADARRWHKEWESVLGERGAYGCLQTLRRVVKYGCELRDPDAMAYRQVLTETLFKKPAKRKVRPVYEQIVKLREAAHAMGLHSIALGTTIQFELGLRQRDVIGEWVTVPKAASRRASVNTRGPTEDTSRPAESLGGIQYANRRWQWGLTWDQIDSDWILRKPTSKSNGEHIAEHDLKHRPDLMAELTRVPPDRRVGPVIIQESTGRPYTNSRYSRRFRDAARAAGWPDSLKNMDSRAGAVSEAFEAGAEPSDVMKAATHRDLATTMGYNRGALEQTSRVALLREERRKRGK